MDESDRAVGRVRRGGDLLSARLPQFGNSSEDSAEDLYRWVEGAAIETIEWYLGEKRSKARWSRFLRVMTVLLVVVGGVIPVVGVASDKPSVAIWGYVPLGLAAGCVGLDRAFGFSSSWIRYLAAATAIERSLMRFQLHWTELEATKVDNSNGSSNWFSTAVDTVRQFADELSELVEVETQSWVSEFRSRVSELEQEASKIK